MKIAQIDVNYLHSSTGKIVGDLTTGLISRGHSAIAYFGRGSDPGIQSAHRVSTNTEVLLHAFATRFTGMTGSYSPIATRRLIRHLSNFNPDIVHLHDLHGYFINIGELVEYLKSNLTPTVWTFHCEFMYTGKCGYALDCEKWKTHCNDCPQLRCYPKSWFFDFTSQMFEQKRKIFEGFDHLHLIAPSTWLADRMQRSPLVGDKPITVIPNGFDIGIFHPKETHTLRKKLNLNDESIVVAVGSNLFSEIKGGKWVLELATLNPEIIFIMIGVTIAPTSLPANVRTIEPIHDQSLLAQYYSLGDVLLLTSAKETFSMVTAESLACGTPVIGFDSGAPKEVAPPGYGVFVPYGKIDELSSLLKSVISGKRSLKLPNECELFAARNYSKDVMIDAYAEIYRKLIDPPKDQK
jgi:putative colanic acid biosynthesis glycosyltransferase